ncbi:hypothetical protein XENORESO_016704 [Xenotaenia resolanae]|uniref:TIR domain-containing protein n=1 Tax=Xenotaenia resolanae TaxID=208358 RepID=A0ABV0WH48_9TELE
MIRRKRSWRIKCDPVDFFSLPKTTWHLRLRMNNTEQENQGTGLREVFDILVKLPSEQLLSLTIQLGESPEDTIIHALCLTIAQKESEALRKLQILEDNPLANHLAEKWRSDGSKLVNFGAHCSQFKAKTGESLISLARIFKVLSEKRLCDPILRNLAYKRAISSESLKANYCGYLEYNHFREEAEAVCGPQFADLICSSSDLKSESSLDSNRTLNEQNAVSRGESTNIHCLPSPLQESPSEASYPSHLEISLPVTVSFQGDKAAAETSGNPNVPAQIQSRELQHTSAGTSMFGAEKDIRTNEASTKHKLQINESGVQSYRPNTETKSILPSATHINLPNTSGPKSTHQSREAGEEEEEEEIFYAFVILHAPEDDDMAESMKEKLEAVIGTTGATFSEEFATLGKSTLNCVEDAVNNSAFTFLLLTRNFNSQMEQMKTNIALMNSINKVHKFNTVIPLLPLDNRMPKQRMPLTLQTLVPLDERKNFTRKLQKFFDKAKIEKQRRIWTEEKRVRRQEKEGLNRCMEQQLVLEASVRREQDPGDPRPWPVLPGSNIHINNANYVMIGNESTMTVGVGASADKDDLS